MRDLIICLLAFALISTFALSSPLQQHHLSLGWKNEPFAGHLPHVDYAAIDHQDDGLTLPPEGMVSYPLHVSGPRDERVNLMFFGDGYTVAEKDKFLADATKLKEDIVSTDGAMSHVAHLLNIWAAFVPSNISGIGSHDESLKDAPFGLYRPGAELRAVFLKHPRRARAACKWFKEGKAENGGCDQPILLGNDPLYGGLGGEFTVITASEKSGPIVLRHELGHSLIDVGEEYEGGYAYYGVNSASSKHIKDLKWKEFLTNPSDVRIEDVKVPLQVYPWHDLDEAQWKTTFESSNPVSSKALPYPSALLRLSVSSIPYPSHMLLSINSVPVDLTSAFPSSWASSLDRRWLELPLPADSGLRPGLNTIEVRLTNEGKKAIGGQGGKMITSLEIMEYGGEGRFNGTEGFVGAFPTYAMDGTMRLRPTNEGCLMRKVDHPTFCPVCAHHLEKRLEDMIAGR